MAKKKVTNTSQSKQPQNLTQPILMAASTDDSSLQIQNLKNLNAVLLKETTQRRQQVDALQSALHRSAITYDTNLAFDVQNAVVSVFLKNQLQEINIRFHTLLGERDCELSLLNRQLNDFTARLQSQTTALANERDRLLLQAKSLEDSLHIETKLRLEAQDFLSQKQRDIEELRNDRDSALRTSQKLLTVIETLKEEIEAVREKNQVQEQKIASLEMDLKLLNESSKKEEESLRANLLQLQGNLGLSLEKEDELKMEISSLLKEKKEMEKSVVLLTEEKDSFRMELERKRHELDEAIRTRGEIEEVTVNLENNIVELRVKVDELEESCRDFEEENNQLVSQVKSYRNAVDEAVLEKESMEKVFDEEKKKVENLELLIAKTQQVVVKSDAELGQVRSEREKLVEKEKMLEGHVGSLRKENDALQSMLVEARRESEDLSAKVQVWCTNSNKALALLKATAAALVCQHKDRGGEEVVSNENHVEEIQPYAQELNAIKKAFRSKDEMVDDMKQQLVSLNKSVAEAHKSKSLWTIISSATTIFAAVLAAYVARGR